MDTAQWPQEIVVKPIEEIVTNTCPKPSPNNINKNETLERKLARPQKDQALNCPRCNSTKTKFCYYNNYSLTQPRYFCKTCRRYWTEGGSLRNIPVGGGSRKNKRSSPISSSTNTNSSSKIMNKLPDLVHPSSSQPQKIMMISQGQDLNLCFPSSANNTASPSTTTQDFRNMSDFIQLPNTENNTKKNSNTDHISALELLTGLTSRGFNSFMPLPVLVQDHHPHDSVYGNNTNASTTTTTTTTRTSAIPGFSLPQEFKPSLNFSLDGLGSFQESNSTSSNGRLLFPFEDLKQVSDTNNNKDQGDSATGYWTGMLGGGSW